MSSRKQQILHKLDIKCNEIWQELNNFLRSGLNPGKQEEWNNKDEMIEKIKLMLYCYINSGKEYIPFTPQQIPSILNEIRTNLIRLRDEIEGGIHEGFQLDNGIAAFNAAIGDTSWISLFYGDIRGRLQDDITTKFNKTCKTLGEEHLICKIQGNTKISQAFEDFTQKLSVKSQREVLKTYKPGEITESYISDYVTDYINRYAIEMSTQNDIMKYVVEEMTRKLISRAQDEQKLRDAQNSLQKKPRSGEQTDPSSGEHPSSFIPFPPDTAERPTPLTVRPTAPTENDFDGEIDYQEMGEEMRKELMDIMRNLLRAVADLDGTADEHGQYGLVTEEDLNFVNTSATVEQLNEMNNLLGGEAATKDQASLTPTRIDEFMIILAKLKDFSTGRNSTSLVRSASFQQQQIEKEKTKTDNEWQSEVQQVISQNDDKEISADELRSEAIIFKQVRQAEETEKLEVKPLTQEQEIKTKINNTTNKEIEIIKIHDEDNSLFHCIICDNLDNDYILALTSDTTENMHKLRVTELRKSVEKYLIDFLKEIKNNKKAVITERREAYEIFSEKCEGINPTVFLDTIYKEFREGDDYRFSEEEIDTTMEKLKKYIKNIDTGDDLIIQILCNLMKIRVATLRGFIIPEETRISPTNFPQPEQLPFTNLINNINTNKANIFSLVRALPVPAGKEREVLTEAEIKAKEDQTKMDKYYEDYIIDFAIEKQGTQSKYGTIVGKEYMKGVYDLDDNTDFDKNESSWFEVEIIEERKIEIEQGEIVDVYDMLYVINVKSDTGEIILENVTVPGLLLNKFNDGTDTDEATSNDNHLESLIQTTYEKGEKGIFILLNKYNKIDQELPSITRSIALELSEEIPKKLPGSRGLSSALETTPGSTVMSSLTGNTTKQSANLHLKQDSLTFIQTKEKIEQLHKDFSTKYGLIDNNTTMSESGSGDESDSDKPPHDSTLARYVDLINPKRLGSIIMLDELNTIDESIAEIDTLIYNVENNTSEDSEFDSSLDEIISDYPDNLIKGGAIPDVIRRVSDISNDPDDDVVYLPNPLYKQGQKVFIQKIITAGDGTTRFYFDEVSEEPYYIIDKKYSSIKNAWVYKIIIENTKNESIEVWLNEKRIISIAKSDAPPPPPPSESRPVRNQKLTQKAQEAKAQLDKSRRKLEILQAKKEEELKKQIAIDLSKQKQKTMSSGYEDAANKVIQNSSVTNRTKLSSDTNSNFKNLVSNMTLLELQKNITSSDTSVKSFRKDARAMYQSMPNILSEEGVDFDINTIVTIKRNELLNDLLDNIIKFDITKLPESNRKETQNKINNLIYKHVAINGEEHSNSSHKADLLDQLTEQIQQLIWKIKVQQGLREIVATEGTPDIQFTRVWGNQLKNNIRGLKTDQTDFRCYQCLQGHNSNIAHVEMEHKLPATMFGQIVPFIDNFKLEMEYYKKFRDRKGKAQRKIETKDISTLVNPLRGESYLSYMYRLINCVLVSDDNYAKWTKDVNQLINTWIREFQIYMFTEIIKNMKGKDRKVYKEKLYAWTQDQRLQMGLGDDISTIMTANSGLQIKHQLFTYVLKCSLLEYGYSHQYCNQVKISCSFLEPGSRDGYLQMCFECMKTGKPELPGDSGIYVMPRKIPGKNGNGSNPEEDNTADPFDETWRRDEDCIVSNDFKLPLNRRKLEDAVSSGGTNVNWKDYEVKGNDAENQFLKLAYHTPGKKPIDSEKYKKLSTHLRLVFKFINDSVQSLLNANVTIDTKDDKSVQSRSLMSITSRGQSIKQLRKRVVKITPEMVYFYNLAKITTKTNDNLQKDIIKMLENKSLISGLKKYYKKMSKGGGKRTRKHKVKTNEMKRKTRKR